jgi:exocyst complex component 7
MAAAPPDGQEVMAAAQHIVKSLASSKNAADDMIRILSGFDNRLSFMSNLFPPPPGAEAAAVGCITEADERGSQEGQEDGPDPDDAAAARDEEWDMAVDLIERWEAADRMVFDSRDEAGPARGGGAAGRDGKA